MLVVKLRLCDGNPRGGKPTPALDSKRPFVDIINLAQDMVESVVNRFLGSPLARFLFLI